MSIDITALIKRAIRQAGMRSRRASMTQSSSPARPGRRRAAAWAAWPAAGIVLVLMAAIAPAAYAATGTAPPAPAPRSALAPAHKNGTQVPCRNLTFSGPTWMHDIATCLSSRKLSHIVIPGSHDSTTYSLRPPSDDLWHTQDEDLSHQLNDGMRQFDIRVEWANPVGGNGWGYYAHHGSGGTDGISTWLKLPNILTSIDQWALVPGHEQEIIMLNLTIDQDSTGPFPVSDCQNFAATLGGSLVTPAELQARFGTADPGQVTLGQLWSLPDPKQAARVIMDNSQCMDAADPSAGQWGPFSPPGQSLYSGYFADQVTADGDSDPDQPDQQTGIKKLVLAAAQTRATGVGAEPTQVGPPKVGGLWVLDIQGTPEGDALITPWNLVPAEKEVLTALFNQYGDDPPTRQNLNIVAGDFVQDTDLFQYVIFMDMYPLAPDAPTITDYTGGDGQVTVDFSEEGSYGTDPITSYTVTATDKTNPAAPPVTATGPGSPLTVKGLTNGDVYLLTVTATNPHGTSLPSQPGGIQVGVPPKVVSNPTATGTVGKPYSSGFTVTGAPPPTVTQVSGNRPPGLTLGSNGNLTGTPTQAGRYTFTVQANNKLNDADATATITIAGAAPTAPAITGLTNGDGQVSVAFSGATAGSAPITSYTVSATDKSHPTTPPVTATGPASPVTVKGLTNGDPYVFTVTATSAAGTGPPSAAYGPLNVGVAPVIVTGPANGTAGQPYSSGFTITGAPPPAVTQVSGNLPPGLTLGSDGTLAGTPTQAGSYEFTVQATNPVGIYSASVTVVISPATLGAGSPAPGGRQLRATICATPAGHQPACTFRTLTGTFPPLTASAAATLLRGTVTYAAGRVTAGYRTLTLSGQRQIPAGSYTLILRYGHHAIIVPVTIR